jgi:hypothetical protein
MAQEPQERSKRGRTVQNGISEMRGVLGAAHKTRVQMKNREGNQEGDRSYKAMIPKAPSKSMKLLKKISRERVEKHPEPKLMSSGTVTGGPGSLGCKALTCGRDRTLAQKGRTEVGTVSPSLSFKVRGI